MEVQKIKTKEEDRRLVSGFMGEEYPIEIDFNLLMPVVEKIQSLACNVNIINDYCQIIRFVDGDNPPAYQRINTLSNSKIENTWTAIVQFIQWYNQNSQ